MFQHIKENLNEAILEYICFPEAKIKITYINVIILENFSYIVILNFIIFQ